MAYFGMVGDSEKSAELDESNQHSSNTDSEVLLCSR